jgi:hypothetical protein
MNPQLLAQALLGASAQAQGPQPPNAQYAEMYHAWGDQTNIRLIVAQKPTPNAAPVEIGSFVLPPTLAMELGATLIDLGRQRLENQITMEKLVESAGSEFQEVVDTIKKLSDAGAARSEAARKAQEAAEREGTEDSDPAQSEE